MILPRTGRLWRLAFMGALSAALGFSFAMATSNDAAGSRGIQTSITRQPTEFFTGSDLGVVVVGSQFTRQIIVRFGYKPHVFSFGSILPTSGFTISDGGTIIGKKDTAGVEQFDVQCVDDIGGDQPPLISKRFSITGVDAQMLPDMNLQFVSAIAGQQVIPLPDAVTNELYTFTIPANGGRPPYIFRFASDADFVALPAGLALDRTGMIFGKPSVPTTTPAVFKLNLLDSNRGVVQQAFSLNVVRGTISSDVVATDGWFKLNFGKEGKDSCSFTMLLNKTDLAKNGIRSTADLKNVPFIMQLGGCLIPPIVVEVDASGKLTGKGFPTTFDATGSIRFPDLRNNITPARGEDSSFTIKLNPKTGVLKVWMQNEYLLRGLGANFNTFANPIIPVNIKMGVPAKTLLDELSKQVDGLNTNAGGTASTADNSGIKYDKTDIIKFMYKRSGNTARGTARANDRLAPGGLFLVTKALGSEQVKGKPATQFDQVAFTLSGYLRMPGGEPLIVKATDTVSLLLGTKGLGAFPASSFSSVGSVLSFANTDTSAALKSIVIDNKKGTFTIQTFPMNPREIFSTDVLIAGEPYAVPLTLTISTPGATVPTFDGQSEMTLFRKGGLLRNK